jgi:hypothetical protein
MPESPPKELVALLERLGLATATAVVGVGRRAARLAGELPRFDSVWLDALAQARILTPFQVAELNAGRGESLRVGPFVLCQRLAHPYYVATYRARNVKSAEVVRLAVMEKAGPRTEAVLRQLEAMVGRELGESRAEGSTKGEEHGTEYEVRSTEYGARSPTALTLTLSQRERGQSNATRPSPLAAHSSPLSLHPSPFPPLPSPLALHPSPFPPHPASFTHAGTDARRVFAAEAWRDGRMAAEWMVHHGRFPAEVVLEIARGMLAGLVELEESGICHGDVSLGSLLLTDGGDAVMVLPGLRGIVRPEEGYAHADLLPEAFDALAPERVAAGTPPNTAGDIYGCGCVWWQMLCGRPPLVGGSSLAKLRAAQAAEICDVRRYAPDVPATLAAAIAACVRREPELRPESMAKLAAMLGPPTRTGKEAVADCLARAGRPLVRWTTTVRKVRRSNRTPLWVAAAVCIVATMVAIFWPAWHGGGRQTAIAGKTEARSPKYGVRSAKHEAARTSGLETPRSASLRPPPSALNRPSSPVVPAAYQQPVQPADDLVLSADKPIAPVALELRAGRCVRTPKGRRATVLAPATGLVVDQEDVRFENIDFVWSPAVSGESTDRRPAAIVQLRVGRVTFHGCSFRLADSRDGRAVAAIQWLHPARAEEAETSLPTGRIELADCLLDGVAAGIDCHTIGALGIELTNVLHLGGGPLLRLDHCPQPDEPVALGLAQVTLRGSGPLVECRIPRGEEQPGEIAVAATACVFAPAAGEPLVQFGGAAASQRLLSNLRWTGQGSLVTPDAPIVACRATDGQGRTVDESSLEIAGLVRSVVRFAGPPSSDPTTSRIEYWQAPLQSTNPPGIDPQTMPGQILTRSASEGRAADGTR